MSRHRKYGRVGGGASVKVRKQSGPNEGAIRVAMAEEGATGDPRDYVILEGSTLTTHLRRYVLSSRLDGREVDVTNVEGDGEVPEAPTSRLVHRGVLWRYLGPAAREFWRQGRRRAGT